MIILATGMNSCGWLLPAYNLHEAASRGDTEKVIQFIEEGEDVNKKSTGVSPLVLALRKCHIETAKELIRRGADVNYTDNVYRTPPIVYAAICNNRDLVQMMLEHGANVNAKTGRGAEVKPGFTALIEAAYHGNTEIGALLLDNGADPGMASEKGVTALSNARGMGHHDFEALLEKYSEIEKSLYTAAINSFSVERHLKYLEVFPKSPNAPSIRNRLEYLPLMNACLRTDRRAVDALLAAGKSLKGFYEPARMVLHMLQLQTVKNETGTDGEQPAIGTMLITYKAYCTLSLMYLLRAGASPFACVFTPGGIQHSFINSEERMTAAAYAAKYNLKDSERLLEENEYNPAWDTLYLFADYSDSPAVIPYSPDYIDVNEAYLKQFPEGALRPQVETALEELYYNRIAKSGSLKDVNNYLSRYPEGKYADSLIKLSAYKPLLDACLALEPDRVDSLLASGSTLSGYGEPARKLMGILQKQITGTIQMSDFKVTGIKESDKISYYYDLLAFYLLIHAGADTSMFCIKDFKKAGTEVLGGGYEMVSSGDPGVLVPAGAGGLSALEFADANGLSGFGALLRGNMHPVYDILKRMKK